MEDFGLNQTKNEKLALLFSFLGYAIFGFSFIFSKEALRIATPFVLLAARFTVAFLIMNGLVLTGKFKVNLRGKSIKLLLLLGIVQPVIYFICENYGIQLLSTSFVGTIIALMPVSSLVLSVILLREKVRLFQVACAVVSVAGVFFTTLGQAAGSFSWIGFVLLLVAVLAASMFNVLSRKISEEFTAFERTYVMFALGCVTFITIALIQSWAYERRRFLAPGRLSGGGFFCGRFFDDQLCDDLSGCCQSVYIWEYHNNYFDSGRRSYSAGKLQRVSGDWLNHHYCQCIWRKPAVGNQEGEVSANRLMGYQHCSNLQIVLLYTHMYLSQHTL